MSNVNEVVVASIFCGIDERDTSLSEKNVPIFNLGGREGYKEKIMYTKYQEKFDLEEIEKSIEQNDI